jgi:hypothetical protein
MKYFFNMCHARKMCAIPSCVIKLDQQRNYWVKDGLLYGLISHVRKLTFIKNLH